MPRSAKCRRVCQMPAHCRFAPEQPAHGEAVELTVEEYEAVRLMDYLGLNQEEASAQMGVARTTVTPSVPRKVAGASAGPAAGVPPKTERKRPHENRSHL